MILPLSPRAERERTTMVSQSKSGIRTFMVIFRRWMKVKVAKVQTIPVSLQFLVLLVTNLLLFLLRWMQPATTRMRTSRLGMHRLARTRRSRWAGMYQVEMGKIAVIRMILLETVRVKLIRMIRLETETTKRQVVTLAMAVSR
jgi:hypothetical protein